MVTRCPHGKPAKRNNRRNTKPQASSQCKKCLYHSLDESMQSLAEELITDDLLESVAV